MRVDDTAQRPGIEVPDITGPGRTEKILKPAPRQTGKRIRGRAKGILLGGAAAVAGAIVVGVLLAGRPGGRRGGNGEGDMAPVEAVGQALPPAPPPPLMHTAGAEGAAAVSPSPNPSFRLAVSRPEGLAGAPGEAVTSARKYRTWLVHQHYKRLEGQVLAEEAARDAPLAQGAGARLLQGQTSPGDGALPPSHPALPRARGQGANRRFLEDQAQRRDANGDLDQILEKPASRHELFAGSVIPAVLLTGIDSDLPGEIVAQVRQNVDNSLDPTEVLIPQGARLIGVYSNQVAYGQRRVLVAWRRIIFPDGATLTIEGMPGTDDLGRAGFHDRVDNHYLRIFGSAFLISTLGAGAQLAQPQNAGALNTPGEGQQAAANLANEMNSVGTNLLNRNLSIQPTLTIRPGYLFDVLVTRTMILPPYPQQTP